MSSAGDWIAEGCYRVDPKYAAPKSFALSIHHPWIDISGDIFLRKFLPMGSRISSFFTSNCCKAPKCKSRYSSMEKIKDKNPLKEKITNQEEQSVASIKS